MASKPTQDGLESLFLQMGYAKAGQNTHGIHTRLFARAFTFDDGTRRSVFVSVDSAMMGQLVKAKVIDKLKLLFGEALYTHKNVVISGTHTHSGPGGYLQYILFEVTTMGYVHETVDYMVEGIVLAIRRAHENMQLSTLYWAEGQLHNANINRSPTSYMANPVEERSQ